ncbi:hypothetical protein DW355_11985 [Hylemonella gracilis]|uniref:Uncharacterized protein n=1 Tax=Hylemonella gracilis TaxID=80880 RepID=A0A4P6UMR8_9BURK|nr:hypothetical protein [Hylemonella gracilis]QBK05367.1 hypothetical protein DW355_11985 [Hylemonella gracilis]
MIHESRYWKQPLLRSARWLEKALVDEASGEKILARAEREVFIGFYAVRKLLATFKLSGTTKRLTCQLISYPAKSKALVDYFNRSDIDEHYDLDNEIRETRDVGFLCNQVVHSFVFIFVTGESGSIEGIFVSSDTMRHRRLYYVALESIVQLFRAVGRDYPSQQHYVRNVQSGQWEVRDDVP